MIVDHDANGPSQLSKREGCPGSGRMEAAVAAEPGAEPTTRAAAADRGTRLHDAIADCIRCDRRPESVDYPSFDEEEIAALQFCYGYYEQLVANCDPEMDPILVEVRVDLTSLGIAKGGTVDLAVIKPGDTFWMADWKFGGLPTRAPRWNRQMQAYAVGLIEQYGCINGGTIAVVQPALKEPVRCDFLTAAELTEHALAIRSIVSRAKKPDAPLIPGDHCTLCNARETCPSRKAIAEATIATKGISSLAAFNALEPSKRLDLYERMKLAKAWVEGALGDVDAAIITGKLEVPGLGIGEGRKSRSWYNDSVAIDALRAAGLAETSIFTSSVISPAVAEKIVARPRLDGVRKVIVSVSGKPRVVRVGSGGLIGEDE